MENKTQKIIIMVIVILALIALVIVIGAIMILKNMNKNLLTDEIEYIESSPVKSELEKVSIRNNYYTVKKILENYYSSLCALNKTDEDIIIYEHEYEGDVEEIRENISNDLKIEIENNKNRILSFFDDDCIQEIGLSIDNIQEKLGNYKDLYIHIDDMYVREITESLNIYFVFGNITEKNNLKKEEFEFMVEVDSHNSTFNIYPSSYVKKHNLYELSKKEDFKEKYYNKEEVEKRKYNKFRFETVNNEKYARDLLNTYTQSIKYNNIDYSYNRLYEEYKTNRFNDKLEYEKYIQEKRKTIIASTLKYYKINIYEDYKQYICVDQDENYYIFNEKATMDYNLILDIYTVDIPEFTEKYKSATNKEKVQLNVQKIEEALKGRDYKYLYNKLDKTFRNNKYPNVNNLQKYIENILFEDYSIEHKDLIQEGEIYIYKAKIKNAKNDSQEKNFNIIMKLEDETDYIFSFNIE